MKKYSLLGAMVLISFLIAFPGCGGKKRHAPKGTVSYDGEPIEWGHISFTPTKGTEGPKSGAEIREGAYEVDGGKGLFKGSYLVTFQAWKREGKVSVDPVTGEKTKGGELKQFLPSKYVDISDKTIEIDGSKQTFDFKLDP